MFCIFSCSRIFTNKKGRLILKPISVSYVFLETCPFPLGCRICWHIIVHSFLLWFFFVFLCYQLLCLLFHFLFCLFMFSFLFGEPSQRPVEFVYPFTKPALGFIDLFYYLLISILFVSTHINFLPSADFGFCFFSF